MGKKRSRRTQNQETPTETSKQPKVIEAKSTKIKESDDIELDFGKAYDWFIKHQKTLLLIALILIPIFLAGYFRAYPAHLPITDTWAEGSVANFYQNQLKTQLKQQFPNLPDANLNERVATQYANLKEQQKSTIEQQVAQTSQEFKNRMKNDAGETYLLAIDPYVYYMDSVNIVDHGYPGEELRDGKPYELRGLAPIGYATESNLHSYINIWIWKILAIFIGGLSLMGGAFWTPLVIASLSTIPAFFLARRKAGNLAGFVAATIVAVHGAFLNRTPAGFSDTDAYNVFFPLLVAWLFLEAFEAKELWKKTAFATGAGLALGVYSFVWIGYWYILNILVFVIIGYLIFTTLKQLYTNYQLRQQNKQTLGWNESGAWPAIKNTLILTAIFIGITGIIVSARYGLQSFLNLPLSMFGFSQLKVAANPNLWPNVLTTVAELNEVTFAGVVGQMGGKFMFWLALLGGAAALLPAKEKLKGRDVLFLGLSIIITLFLVSTAVLNANPTLYLLILMLPLTIGGLMLLTDKRKIDIKFALLLLIWFVATMYATTKGVRFTLVLVPTFAISIGVLLGMVHKHLSQLLETELELPKKLVVPILAILLCMVLIAPIKAADNIALNEIPSMNDAWYGSLTNIRDNSAENAIITSWWDFGHWFKAIAERPVTFDGGTQNTPMAHWVGKLLLTEDEDESTGILRMLDCGSSTAFTLLEEKLTDTIHTKKVLDEIILMNHDDAKKRLLNEGLSEVDADAVLELAHCNPPEAFLITSQDMVGKAGVWGHFGSWDFEKAYIYNRLRGKTQEVAAAEMISKFNYTEEKAKRVYFEVKGLTSEAAANSWISPWPNYVSGWIGCTEQVALVNKSEGDGSVLENRTVAVCPVNLNLGNNAGTDARADTIIIDVEEPANSRIRVGLYQGGVRYSQTDQGLPKKLVIAHENASDGIESFSFEEQGNNIGATYDVENKRIILSDPLHAGSIFMQLFYLDGKYNKQYELFSDRMSFNGQRIIVWKVNWDEDET